MQTIAAWRRARRKRARARGCSAAERQRHRCCLRGTARRFALAALPRGCLASGSADAMLRLWDAAGACERVLAGHKGMVTSVTALAVAWFRRPGTKR